MIFFIITLRLFDPLELTATFYIKNSYLKCSSLNVSSNSKNYTTRQTFLIKVKKSISSVLYYVPSVGFFDIPMRRFSDSGNIFCEAEIFKKQKNYDRDSGPCALCHSSKNHKRYQSLLRKLIETCQSRRSAD